MYGTGGEVRSILNLRTLGASGDLQITLEIIVRNGLYKILISHRCCPEFCACVRACACVPINVCSVCVCVRRYWMSSILFLRQIFHSIRHSLVGQTVWLENSRNHPFLSTAPPSHNVTDMYSHDPSFYMDVGYRIPQQVLYCLIYLPKPF